MSTFFWTYDPNEHKYSISYDTWRDKLNDIDYIMSEDAITVTFPVNYDAPYANDNDNCERFFEETESIDNENFMKVCAALANKLNYEICEF